MFVLYLLVQVDAATHNIPTSMCRCVSEFLYKIYILTYFFNVYHAFFNFCEENKVQVKGNQCEVKEKVRRVTYMHRNIFNVECQLYLRRLFCCWFSLVSISLLTGLSSDLILDFSIPFVTSSARSLRRFNMKGNSSRVYLYLSTWLLGEHFEHKLSRCSMQTSFSVKINGN